LGAGATLAKLDSLFEEFAGVHLIADFPVPSLYGGRGGFERKCVMPVLDLTDENGGRKGIKHIPTGNLFSVEWPGMSVKWIYIRTGLDNPAGVVLHGHYAGQCDSIDRFERLIATDLCPVEVKL
jgi:hypothetical protein